MPRLVLFAPSQKVLVDASDSTVSLIGILENLEVPEPTLDSSGEAPAAAVPWSVITIWQADPADAGAQFEQRVELIRPDRTIVADIRNEFALDQRTVRIRASIEGFPVARSGQCELRLSLRNLGDDAWQRVTEFPIWVAYSTRPPEG